MKIKGIVWQEDGVWCGSVAHLVDGLHAAIAIYSEEENLQQVRQFMQKMGLSCCPFKLGILQLIKKLITLVYS